MLRSSNERTPDPDTKVPTASVLAWVASVNPLSSPSAKPFRRPAVSAAGPSANSPGLSATCRQHSTDSPTSSRLLPEPNRSTSNFNHFRSHHLQKRRNRNVRHHRAVPSRSCTY